METKLTRKVVLFTNNVLFLAIKVVPPCVTARPETSTVQVNSATTECFFNCFVGVVTAMAINVPRVLVFHAFLFS